MPTVMRKDGYRFFFFSDEHDPEHIHIEKGESYVRIEIESMKVTHRYKISSKEVNRLIKLVEQHKTELMEAWNEHFKK